MKTPEEHITWKHPLVVSILDPDREKALLAWNFWRSSTDLDQIANTELTVIPMVYQRWKEDPGFVFDERIVGVARKSFFQNALYLQADDEITGTLSAQDIPYRFVHDSLIRYTLSQNISNSRVVQSVDLWIPDRIDEAVGIAHSLGWRYDRHFRLRAAFINDHGLRLNLYHRFSRHWTSDRHERFFAELNHSGTGTQNCIIDLLQSKFPHGQPVDLQSVIDLYLLFQGLSEKETRDLIQSCQYYLLSHRLAKGIKILNHPYGLNAIPTLSDQLAFLEFLFQKWLQQRSLSAKYAYHSNRIRSMKSVDDNSVTAFYRYWHMHRLENKKTREWISSLKSTLNLK